MNLTMAMACDIGTVHIGQMLALPSLETKVTADRVSATADRLFSSIASVIDELLSATVSRRTASEFLAKRAEVFPHYFHAMRALSDLTPILVQPHTLEMLAAESFSEREALFRDHGLTSVGAAVRDQAIFTIWTLRKISELCRRIDEHKVPVGQEGLDRDLFCQFIEHSLTARFHLDCLQKSIETAPMTPEVLDIVLDGLRHAVNAYAWARRAHDLRIPQTQEGNVNSVWDDEDEQLLDEANRDMVTEP